jgi:hypothetical protein
VVTKSTSRLAKDRSLANASCSYFIATRLKLLGGGKRSATTVELINALYYLAAGGGFSPVVSTFSVVVLVALSGLVSTFSSTDCVVVPPGVVTVVSVFVSLVFVGSQPMVVKPTIQAIVK